MQEDDENTKICNACIDGDIEEVTSLLESGIDALHMAISRDHLQIVRFLLQNGADSSILDSNGRTCLEHARYIAQTEEEYEYEDFPNIRDIVTLIEDFENDPDHIKEPEFD